MTLKVQQLGHGPDLVLLHGWGFDSRVWSPVQDRLAERCTLHLLDLPGYGFNRAVQVSGHEELLDAIIACIPDGASLGGWSLGGQLAMAAAEKVSLHPRAKSLRGLALISTTPSFISRKDWPHGLAPELLSGFRTATEAGVTGLLRHFAGLIHQGEQNARDLARLFASLHGKHQPDTNALLQGLDLLRDTDLHVLLPKLRLPALVLHGARDPLMSLAGAQAMCGRLPHACLEVFPAAAHAPFHNDPVRFTALLAEFVMANSAYDDSGPVASENPASESGTPC